MSKEPVVIRASSLSEIPFGFCHCGCGEKTKIHARTDKATNRIKGEPSKYLNKTHANNDIGKRSTKKAIGKKGKSSHGYIRVQLGNGVRQYEHIIIAEKALGRPLKSFGRGHPDTEVVHHVYGDKTKNGSGNLVICTHSYHTELHHRLEESPDWPEFPKITRNDKRGIRHEQ